MYIIMHRMSVQCTECPYIHVHRMSEHTCAQDVRTMHSMLAQNHAYAHICTACQHIIQHCLQFATLTQAQLQVSYICPSISLPINLSIWCQNIKGCDLQVKFPTFGELSNTRAKADEILTSDIGGLSHDCLAETKKQTPRNYI